MAPETDYDRLPEAIRHRFSRKEWLWMSDREKRDLVQSECEPEDFND